MKSKRPDKRGHWPPRKRRNDPGVTPRELRALCRRIKRIVAQRFQPGSVSFKAVARYAGVSDRALHRWLNGSHYPPATKVRKLQRWAQRNE